MADQSSGCPVVHSGGGQAPQHGQAPQAAQAEQSSAEAARLAHPTEGDANQQWWPKRLNLRPLAHNPQEIRPTAPDFDYTAAFESLDLPQVKQDIAELLTTSQDWWPADFGNYGPLIIRMAWHSAGTYRAMDGRGGAGAGQQRFAPLNSWPDNAGLDKARRILWPIKKKYGQALSWADLMVLAGNVALESMGFETLGFAGGREDVWEPEEVFWGAETDWLGTDARYSGTNHTTRELSKPFGATTMGLIYVNPEGPEGNPDPAAAAHDIRETFARMSMDDEETLALIAGGHTFGKTHGAAPDNEENVGPEPEGAPLEQQGLGWKNHNGSGKGDDQITSGIEVTWTYHPTRWDNEFFHILFAYEWEPVRGEGGHWHWRPKDGGGADMVPMAHSESRREPRMLTTDISLRVDPAYEKIARRFKDDHKAFSEAFARAWFKLTHRDLGPKARYAGPEVPAQDFAWQDPLPAATGEPIDSADAAALSQKVLDSGLTVSQLVKTAWAAASSFRGSDKRGGANGARIRLEPQRSWEVNEPAQLAVVLDKLEEIQAEFNEANAPTHVSLADLIVLAGNAAIEKAAAEAGVPVKVPFTPGRVDATQEQTDVHSFSFLEPEADGFRNYQRTGLDFPAEHLLVDRAELLGLTAPQMTALVGGLRVLGANYQDAAHGVLTDRPGQLTNDWFVNLLELGNDWVPANEDSTLFQCRDAVTGEEKWTGTRADLVFASNSELRALAEVYASDDAREKFVQDFVAAWTAVTEADRFDLHR
ncbi:MULTISPECIES: catalase/peroxidase HPI [Brevibacterium]|uniref:Catalase-peroxidase n=1 Tax=Brevibacterium salitolerans TaxID=1403566 RepID=A0ABN2WN62_9MICO|nr:catalase/peroxidase HPI [Brevibacterium sp.]